jgi:hypothetical protein
MELRVVPGTRYKAKVSGINTLIPQSVHRDGLSLIMAGSFERVAGYGAVLI